MAIRAVLFERTSEAHASFERAIACARNNAERELLARKLHEE